VVCCCEGGVEEFSVGGEVGAVSSLVLLIHSSISTNKKGAY